jgi:small-conductance mechanosensitive channel
MFDYSITSQMILNLAIAVSVTAFSYLCSLLTKEALKKTAKAEGDEAPFKTFLIFEPLLAPALAAFLMLIAQAVLHKGQMLDDYFKLFVMLAFAWLILALIFIGTQSKRKTRLSALFILPVVVLNHFGLLSEMLVVLNSQSFTIGSYQITLYKIVSFILSTTLMIWIASTLIDLYLIQIRKSERFDVNSQKFLTAIGKFVIYFIGALFIMDVIGLDLKSLAILSGGLAIGIGFGLQKIASNFISGLILLFEKTVKEKDLIELDAQTRGFVKHTGPRYTLLETFDQREIMIPNEDFITKQVINWTLTSRVGRVDITLGVAYGSDLALVKKILLDAAKTCSTLVQEPEPICHLDAFGDSAVIFKLYFWIEDITLGRGLAKSDVLFEIWRQFEQHRITIPYPRRELFIMNADAPPQPKNPA